MRNDYFTVKSYGESEIILSKSRFITYVNRAETEQEALAFIEKIKKCMLMLLIIAPAT